MTEISVGRGVAISVRDDDDTVVVLCYGGGGDGPSSTYQTVAAARATAATLAGVLAGEPMPAGWTVQRTAAGFFVRNDRRRIVGHRHPGDYPGDTATAADCLRLADRLDPRT